MTDRPVIRDANGYAVAEIQELRDAVELTVGQEIGLLFGATCRQIDDSSYWHVHDQVVERLYPSDVCEIAFLLGKKPPQTPDEAETQDTQLYELLSFSHDQMQARFGGDNLVVVSVNPTTGLHLKHLIKLTPEGAPDLTPP